MPFSNRQRQGGDVAAIFVHAGAGYHSVQNEKIHLAACADAAKSAMCILKNGGSAIDACEIAIKVLEDKEITNAGFGSNLAIDGTVECDATIVDHYGRSGGVGAVSQITNPIHLARLVLEHSTKPLSLRRVPPNLLVGQGATDFAFECGMPVMPNDYLVSPAARERWIRWNRDLKQAERQEEYSQSGKRSDDRSDTLEDSEQEQARTSLRPALPHQFSGLRNESQTYSPRITPTGSPEVSSIDDRAYEQHAASSNVGTYIPSPLNDTFSQHHQLYTDSARSPESTTQSPWTFTPQGNDGPSAHRRQRSTQGFDPGSFNDVNSRFEMSQRWSESPMGNLDSNEVVEDSGNRMLSANDSNRADIDTESQLSTSSVASILPIDSQFDGAPLESDFLREDAITDTVGAIAVDCYGNIAAGSSSGGIGMKHKGRTGPAALVGIGTSVFPIEPDDKTKTCVAAVTSGTGEHMATTSAASLCATRLYYNQKKGRNGTIVPTDEESAIRAFIEKDFMRHPSVKNSHSAGAIGVMAVKKTTEGLWLHFAHNTDSFALASMHSEEQEPACVMSRGKGNNTITTGARSLKHRVRKLDSSSRSSTTEEPKVKKQRTTKQ